MRRAHKAWLVLLVVLAWAFIILIISAVILHRFPWYAQRWADVLGIVVAALACVQWLPQLWTTWHLGHLGSLSVVAVAISTPVCTVAGQKSGSALRTVSRRKGSAQTNVLVPYQKLCWLVTS